MKRIVAFMLAVVFMAISFVACTNKKDELEPGTEIVTDANGEPVTDADGNVVTRKVTSANDKTTTSSAKSSGSTASTKSAEELLNMTDPPKGSPNDLYKEGTTVTTKKNAKTKRAEIVEPIIKSKSYILKAVNKTTAGDMSMSFTQEKNDICASLSFGVSGLTIEIRMLAKDNKFYIVSPFTKRYTEANEEEFGIDISNFSELSNTKHKYVSTTEVVVDNTRYVCESYINDDGTTQKMYFLGNNWKRWEIVNGDDISVFEITSFNRGSDSSMLSIPSGYTQVADTESLFKY